MSEPLIKVSNVSKIFKTKDNTVEALRKVKSLIPEL